MSEAKKAFYADPANRAAQCERMKEAAKHRVTQFRLGVPDGMRKPEATVKWAEGGELANRLIKVMEENGAVDAVVVPGSEEAIAKEALRQAATLAFSPLCAKDKAAALRLVLDFTKSKPESKSKVTVNKAEEWLAEIANDMKKEAGDSAAD